MDNEEEQTELPRLLRRSLLQGIGASAFLGTGVGFAQTGTAKSENFETLWSISLQKEVTSLQTVDIDGDGSDEIAVADKVPWGQSEFGIIKDGSWLWKESSLGAVETGPVGDFDGDGIDEVVFRGRAGLRWIRPYTADKSYLWHGDYPGLPGSTVTRDYDGDGTAEVSATSGPAGYLYLYDDDGTTLWGAASPSLVNHVCDLRKVDEDARPEALVDNDYGLSLLRQSGVTGISEVWNYGPRGTSKGKFTDLDGDGKDEVLAASLDTGEVHAIDPTDGSNIWTESTGLTAGDAKIFERSEATEAVLWNGSELVVVDGATRQRANLSIDVEIEEVYKVGESQFVVVTSEFIGVLDREQGVTSRHPVDRTVEDIAIGDIDGDNQLEVVVGYSDEIIAYRTQETTRDSITASISITNDNSTRVIQTISNTRISDVDNSNVDDPPIVADVPASVAFGLSTDGISNLPDTSVVTVSVSIAGTSASFSTFTLTKSQIQAIAQAKYPGLVLADVFAEENSPPVFIPNTGMDSVKIEIESTDLIDGDSITLRSDTDFTVASMPSLKIGLVEVRAPKINGEFPYGSINNGGIAGSLVDFKSRFESFLKDEYPVSDVEIVVASNHVVGSDKPTTKSIHKDLGDAYEKVYNEYPDVDVALAVVPNFNKEGSNSTYFTYHKKSVLTKGVEPYANVSVFQPQESAAVMWFPERGYPLSLEATEEVAAQEITHHFLPTNTYDNQYTWSGDKRSIHVRPKSNSNSIDPDGVKSTKFDIGTGTYDVENGLYSFMSYVNVGRYSNGTSYDVASDALTHTKLIDSQFEPSPPETAQGLFGRVLRGYVDTEDGVLVGGLRSYDGNPLPSAEGGSITVRVRDREGSILDERVTTYLGNTHHGGEGGLTAVAQFVVPFEDTAARIEVENDGERTSFNPISSLLSEMITALPDEAFAKNHDNRRKVLQNKLSAVGKQMQQQAFRGAKQKMQRDIRRSIIEWLADDYQSAANQPTKQELIDAVDEMIRRLDIISKK